MTVFKNALGTLHCDLEKWEAYTSIILLMHQLCLVTQSQHTKHTTFIGTISATHVALFRIKIKIMKKKIKKNCGRRKKGFSKQWLHRLLPGTSPFPAIRLFSPPTASSHFSTYKNIFKCYFGSLPPGSQLSIAKCWCFSAVPSLDSQQEMISKITLYNMIELPVIQLQESLLHSILKISLPVRLFEKIHSPVRNFYYIT